MRLEVLLMFKLTSNRRKEVIKMAKLDARVVSRRLRIAIAARNKNSVIRYLSTLLAKGVQNETTQRAKALLRELSTEGEGNDSRATSTA